MAYLELVASIPVMPWKYSRLMAVELNDDDDDDDDNYYYYYYYYYY
jgi:hypothetical protein